jgi:hypothetical protein
MRRLLLSLVVGFAAILVLPWDAHAQAAIAGVVKDGTGAALPGVTVEASSPALIERTRSAVTDSAGQYRINDLSPGTYSVTFTIAGFKPFRRAGIVLEGNFTAPVNTELEVGNVNETITVTGETPVVDVVSNRATVVVNREMMDAIPTATRSLQARAWIIPGTMVTPVGSGQTSMTIYGSQSGDAVVMVDGMRLNLLEGQGQFSGIYLNDGMAQEISYDTGSQSAEVAQGGLRVNMIPREGGNTFSGIFFIQGANGPLASDNRSDEVKAFIPQPLGLAYTYEINPSFGGPIKRDKAWFYFTYKLQDTKSYTTLPDRSQGTQQNWPNYSYVTRVTWQATSRDKIRFYFDKQMNGQRYEGLGATTTIEASHKLWTPSGQTPQLKWMQATTNRLMLEAGITLYDLNFRREPQPGVGPLDLPRFEVATGVSSGTYAGTMDSGSKNYTSAASATYVTGSHSFKAGMNYGWGRRLRSWPSPNPADILQLRFTNSVPTQVQVRNTPIDESIERMNADFGLYAQDAWTMNRLTLNLGARYDYFNAEVPALSAPASQWVAARDRPAVENVPNWKDWAVRLAAAYDLFGTGKTAIKVNASKYVASAALGFAEAFNTMTAATETRTWNDADGNRSVLDANGAVQRNEIIGGTANFGQASGTDRPDPELQREYNWEYGATIQHELFPRVSVSGGYHRRTYGNLAVTDNLNLSVDEWTPFEITAPSDPRLPGGGNFPITMYTLNPNKVGAATDNLRTFSTKNARVYNGVDLNVNARIGATAFLLGGVTHERAVSTTCDQRDNPNGLRFCDSSGPFRTLFKLAGSYELPYAVQIAGSFIARPGASISANYTVTSALAGRPIISNTAGAAQIAVNLVEPNTMFYDYINQVDLRVARTFRFGKYRLQGLVDIYNLLNAGTVTTLNTTFGAVPATRVWLNPQTIQTSRYVRFGAQLNF